MGKKIPFNFSKMNVKKNVKRNNKSVTNKKMIKVIESPSFGKGIILIYYLYKMYILLIYNCL